MKILFIPFFSQQDKTTGLHLLENDSATRIYNYMAGRCVEVGWDATLVLPAWEQHKTKFVTLQGVKALVSPLLPGDNLSKRVSWNAAWLRYVAATYDVVVTAHETYTVPLRAFNKTLKIVVEAGFLPTTGWDSTEALHQLALQLSTASYCNSKRMCDYANKYTAAWYWPFGYNKSDVRSNKRDVDVVFCGRASATDYSNHKVFIEAVQGAPYSVVMPDPTSYLRKVGCGVGVPTAPLSRQEYLDLLSRTRVVVSLIDNGGFPFGLMEALAMGCCAVVPRRPAYEYVFGAQYAHYCELNAASVKGAVYVAAKYGQSYTGLVAPFEYSEVWKTAEQDIRRLL